MTNYNQVVKLSSFKKLELEKQENLKYAFSSLKLTIKEYKKKLELLTEEVSNLFEKKKTNILFMKDKDKNVLGYIQLITRKTKRFDSTAFKEKYPQLFEEFLVEGSSVEFKPFIDEVYNDNK
jgi:hypothetical protein